MRHITRYETQCGCYGRLCFGPSQQSGKSRKNVPTYSTLAKTVTVLPTGLNSCGSLDQSCPKRKPNVGDLTQVPRPGRCLSALEAERCVRLKQQTPERGNRAPACPHAPWTEAMSRHQPDSPWPRYVSSLSFWLLVQCTQPGCKRHRGDSSPCGQSPMDF